ncbi:hypothetical protein ACFWVM_29145 [Nocardia fluminea]|uniref:hypothetical protein n=1 Tax=Nocardia fluminea TaxID=134984 RepID=UPI003669EAC2
MSNEFDSQPIATVPDWLREGLDAMTGESYERTLVAMIRALREGDQQKIERVRRALRHIESRPLKPSQ